MPTLGVAVIAPVLVALAVTVRSCLRPRRWRRHAQQLPPPLLAWHLDSARHAGVRPAVEWNFRHVGTYHLPDIALLLVLAVVPDLIQAAYMMAPSPSTVASASRVPRIG